MSSLPKVIIIVEVNKKMINFVTDMRQEKRHIAIVTSTRADWGLLSPVARELQQRENIALSIIATNMHLDPLRGMTISEIRSDGFEPCTVLPLLQSSDSDVDTAISMGYHLADVAKVLSKLRPDLLLLLGDRYEMLAVASAATLLHIPVAHIAGGEITVGAIDDNIRHAISKLSSLHFATTEQHRRRLIAMGEQPGNVINAGALGVWNMRHAPMMSRKELEQSLQFHFAMPTLLVTYHPATNDAVAPAQRFGALLKALDTFPGCSIIITYPNNDPDSNGLIDMINDFASENSGRVLAVPSLGALRYRSALQHVAAVVGNSSSGIVEVPSAGVPVVNIGIRQQGRTVSKAVIHCGDTSTEIEEAIRYALTPEARQTALDTPNPYEHDNTIQLIVDTLASCDINKLLPKQFYDI